MRVSYKGLFSIAVLLLCCGVAGFAGPISEPPELGNYTIDATWPALVAADWAATESGWVSSVLIYTGWRDDGYGELDSIMLSLHDNTVRDQGVCSYSQPEDQLWSYMATGFELGSSSVAEGARTWCAPQAIEFLDENNSYSFPITVELDSVDWFWTDMGETYWLSVTMFPAVADSAQCGIVSAVNHVGESAAAASAEDWNWFTLDYYYVQGDVTCDDVVDGDDFEVYLYGCNFGWFPPYVYPGGEPFQPADLNCDGTVNISDCVYLIQWWFNGGPPPNSNCMYPPRDSLEAAICINTMPAPFICGDPDRTQTINVTDCVYLINYIFNEGPPPDPQASGDSNCDTHVNITDAVYLIQYIFSGGPAPCAECP